MPVASGTLFHFTKELETLRKIILESRFIPGICAEDYSFLMSSGRKLEFRIPMVCFCDIPLHLIKEHVGNYGSHGIGLSKDWGIRKMLNPVFYIADTAPSSRITGDGNINLALLKTLTKDMAKTGGNLSKTNYELFCYLKPHKGTGRDSREKIFYEEREWRYVPPVFGNRKNMALFRELQKNRDAAHENKAKETMVNYPLGFEATDLAYIFVKGEAERGELIKTLGEIPGLDELSIRSLCSKIFLTDRINEDV